MKQQTLAGFEKCGKRTQGRVSLADAASGAVELFAPIEPVYPKASSSEGGRPPVPLVRMLRVYVLQAWFNPFGPAVEEALAASSSNHLHRTDKRGWRS